MSVLQNRNYRLILLAGLLVLALLGGILWSNGRLQANAPDPHAAVTNCSASFCLNGQVLGGGIAPMASTQYQMQGTLGQTMAGLFEGSSYDLTAGYWARGEPTYQYYLPSIVNQ